MVYFMEPASLILCTWFRHDVFCWTSEEQSKTSQSGWVLEFNLDIPLCYYWGSCFIYI